MQTTTDLGSAARLRLVSTDNRTAEARVVGLYEPHPFYPLLESVSVLDELFD